VNILPQSLTRNGAIQPRPSLEHSRYLPGSSPSHQVWIRKSLVLREHHSALLETCNTVTMNAWIV
jgi:hypothetical protein